MGGGKGLEGEREVEVLNLLSRFVPRKTKYRDRRV